MFSQRIFDSARLPSNPATWSLSDAAYAAYPRGQSPLSEKLTLNPTSTIAKLFFADFTRPLAETNTKTEARIEDVSSRQGAGSWEFNHSSRTFTSGAGSDLADELLSTARTTQVSISPARKS
jgi:hypothetical protein